MPPAFPGRLYQDPSNVNVHRGVAAAVIATRTIDLGIGHNNFTPWINLKLGTAALANRGVSITWDYHPTIKGAFNIFVWKVTAAGDTTLIAATAAVDVSFVAIAGASVVGG